MDPSGQSPQNQVKAGSPEQPSASSARFPKIYMVAFALCTLVATATTVWILRNEYAKELNYWSERLTRVADTNTLLLKLWIQQRNKDAEILASFPTVKASVLAYHAQTLAEHAHAHTSIILDSARVPELFSAIYVINNEGKVAASSSNAPPLRPEILQACRAFGKTGILTLPQPENDTGFPPLVVIAPVRAPSHSPDSHSTSGEAAGAVVLVTQNDVLKPLFHSDVRRLRPVKPSSYHNAGRN